MGLSFMVIVWAG
ncbi:TPA: hypothetical protein QIF82_004877, partial [Klebsiella quasipneumoniae subsp. similipneumoniae]|nr:hypothetical protein [Klebsiella quasipneumoniae subsp. similipneumoniae]